ncbi:MAG TPA: hypothetical protein VF188_02760 [Longimicrobiales bacterium]
MSRSTIRAIILTILALLSLAVPIPEATREEIADHLSAIISAVLALWALIHGLRARRESRPPAAEEGER